MKRYVSSGLRVLGACCALSVAPNVWAENAPIDPSQPGPATPPANPQQQAAPGSSYGQQPQNQTRVPEAIEKAPPAQSSSDQKASSNQASADMDQKTDQKEIDQKQVQQVFGQQASVVNLTSLDHAEIRNMQQRLKDLGYYMGRVDGIAGPQTRAALSSISHAQFLLSYRMLQKGQMPSQLAESLGVGNGIVPTSGSAEDDGPVNDQPTPPPSATPDLPDSNSPGTTPPHAAPSDPRRDQATPPAPYDAPRTTPPYDYPDTPSGTPGQGDMTPHG